MFEPELEAEAIQLKLLNVKKSCPHKQANKKKKKTCPILPVPDFGKKCNLACVLYSTSKCFVIYVLYSKSVTYLLSS